MLSVSVIIDAPSIQTPLMKKPSLNFSPSKASGSRTPCRPLHQSPKGTTTTEKERVHEQKGIRREPDAMAVWCIDLISCDSFCISDSLNPSSFHLPSSKPTKSTPRSSAFAKRKTTLCPCNYPSIDRQRAYQIPHSFPPLSKSI